jgi:GYF domain 2
MNYYVARNGQTYGPYSPETVQKYLAEGSILATDAARTEAMPDWIPLGQLVAAPAGPAPSISNPPPSLHWALVFLFNLLTGGIFGFVWIFVQAGWVKSIDPSSTAIRDYLLGMILGAFGGIAFGISTVVAIGTGDISPDNLTIEALGSMGMGFLILMAFVVAGVIFHIKALFGMRASLVRYYNTVEPINLRLSAIMTLIFNILYFQYHFTRIANWKRTGFLEPQK